MQHRGMGEVFGALSVPAGRPSVSEWKGATASGRPLRYQLLPSRFGAAVSSWLRIISNTLSLLPNSAKPGSFRDVAWFAVGGVVLVGAWFVVIQWVGSKQPLFYYYIYDAGLTQAQTQPVAQIAKAFYAKYSWSSLSLLPLHNLINSVFPIHFFAFLKNLFSFTTPWKVSDLAATIFESQRFCILAAVGLAALPVVLVGVINTLSKRYTGRTILTLYPDSVASNCTRL